MLREGNGAILHNRLAPRGSQSASTSNSVSPTAPRGGDSPERSREHGTEADTEGLEQGA